jgi:hypothetical protein
MNKMHTLQCCPGRKYHFLKSTKGNEFYGDFNYLRDALNNPTTLTNSNAIMNYKNVTAKLSRI